MYVSSRRLHETRLFVPCPSADPNSARSRAGESIAPVTLFPFFDGQGRTTGLLVVETAQAGRPAQLKTVRMDIDSGQKRPGKKIWPRLFRSFRLGERPQPLDDQPPDWLSRSWHFDPWWLLELPGLDSHPAAPALKATNVVPYLPRSVDRFYFSTYLDRVKSVRKLSSEGASLVPYRSEKLRRLGWQVPDEPRQPTPGGVAAADSKVGRGGWRLVPDW